MSPQDEKRSIIERKRNITYLISKYLSDAGMINTNSMLISEAKLSKTYQICDNIDLETIYLEFLSFYNMKFGKSPKILKKTDVSNNETGDVLSPPKNIIKTGSKPKITKICSNIPDSDKKCERSLSLDETLTISPLSNDQISRQDSIEEINTPTIDFISSNFEFLALDFNKYSPEFKQFASIVCADIISKKLNVNWSDVFGANDAILSITEGIILPLEHPELFDNILPWKSILLHGPPGTGKTLIAKALCTETFNKVTFFNVTPSTYISKWRGDSEKIIRTLFEIAKYYAPSIIFIDEIDCITSQRDKFNEHEASKRLKNELLTLIDGIESDNNGVFILASSNIPWEIDLAFLRRFEKKILIDIPEFNDRIKMIKHFLPQRNYSNQIYEQLSNISSGFTGDEIRIACKEVKMMEIRQKIKHKDDKTKYNSENIDPITAFKKIHPISLKIIDKHREWNKICFNL